MIQAWTSERLYFDGDAFFTDVAHAIASATSTVELETYIFDPDEIGFMIENALTEAVKRGVRARLLVDGIGASVWAESRSRELERTGVKVRIYHPVKFASLFRRLLLDVGVRRRTASKSSRLIARLNRRDHRKMVLVDGRYGWVGSMNISAVHSAKAVGTLAWRDTAARVEGDGIPALLNGFNFAWARAHSSKGKRRWRETFFPPGTRKKLHAHSPLVRSNYTVSLRRKHFADFSRRLRKAKKRIWITNAYLAPSAPVMRRLVRAARRGTDVRIIVPRRSDVFFMPWVAAAHYGPLLKAGVRIFEYLPRFLHAKSVFIDDWYSVGTSNLNRRSLLRDFEVDIILAAPESRTALEAQFEKDMKDSTEVHSAPIGLYAWAGKIIIYFMKQWI